MGARIQEKPLKAYGYVEVFVSKGAPKVTATGKRTHLPKNHPLHNYYEKTAHYEGETIIDFSDAPLVDHVEGKNIVVDGAKDLLIEALETGFMKLIGRMSIGDRGTLPSDSTSPKVPKGDRSELFNEVYRTDIDQITKTKIPTDSLLNVPGTYKIQFTTTFSALDVPLTAMSNQTNPVVNEAGLIMLDALGGNPLPRGPVSAPDSNDADEELFAMRAFKSVPFDQANELQITIRYTIGFE